jgi:hypothetical protein
MTSGLTTGANGYVENYLHSTEFPKNPESEFMLQRLHDSFEFRRTRIDKEEFFVHKTCPYPKEVDESEVVEEEGGEFEWGGRDDWGRGRGRVCFERLKSELYQIPRECQNISHVEDASVIGFPGIHEVKEDALLKAVGGNRDHLERWRKKRDSRNLWAE